MYTQNVHSVKVGTGDKKNNKTVNNHKNSNSLNNKNSNSLNNKNSNCLKNKNTVYTNGTYMDLCTVHCVLILSLYIRLLTI